MLRLQLEPFIRGARMALGLVPALAGGVCLVGPTVAALATTPPSAPPNPAREVALTVPVIRVKTFTNVGDQGCFPLPPLHEGPAVRTGSISHAGHLRQRIESAMWRCLDDWRGDIALSVEVDAAGKITDVIAEGTDQRMRACVSSRLYDEGSVETYGPGRLYVTYFMGEQG